MKAKRILVVDDDERVLFVLHHALARLPGCEVLLASNGHDALQAIGESKLDLLITDIRLPGPSGIHLTEALRRRSPGTPVIWISAHHDPHLPAQARELGVYHYLAKPLEIGEIRAAVREALTGGSPAP